MYCSRIPSAGVGDVNEISFDAESSLSIGALGNKFWTAASDIGAWIIFSGPGFSFLTIMESRLFEDKSSAGFKSAGKTRYEISKRTDNQMEAVKQRGTCPQILFL
jgi:hypothetical protein